MSIGDYVRTYNGIIGEIIDINKAETFDRYEIDYNNKLYSFEQIIKSSPNIIDLIEVGDYVNGYKVLRVEKDYLFDYREEINVLIVQNDEVYEVAKKIYSDDIKSIVTKEQFDAMKYEVI